MMDDVCVMLVVKVIWQQAASQPHMDGSMVFARWRQCPAPPNICLLESTRVQIPSGISIGSAVFAGFTVERPYTLQWAALSPKNCPWSGPPSNTWFLGPIRVLNANGYLNRFGRFVAGLTTVTEDRPADRQTDRPRCSVCNNRPHLCT